MKVSADEFFRLDTLEIKAARKVARLHGINKYELNVLSGIVACMTIKGLRCLSVHDYENWTGMPFSIKLKTSGYIRGCLLKGLLIEMGNYRGREGTRSVAITPKGVKILDEYYKALDELMSKTVVKGTTYKDLGVSADQVAELLPHYTLMSNPDNTYKGGV